MSLQKTPSHRERKRYTVNTRKTRPALAYQLLEDVWAPRALAAACHLLTSHENAEPDERLWPCKHSAASLIFEAM
jgi:hypothetical protein